MDIGRLDKKLEIFLLSLPRPPSTSSMSLSKRFSQITSGAASALPQKRASVTPSSQDMFNPELLGITSESDKDMASSHLSVESASQVSSFSGSQGLVVSLHQVIYLTILLSLTMRKSLLAPSLKLLWLSLLRSRRGPLLFGICALIWRRIRPISAPSSLTPRFRVANLTLRFLILVVIIVC